MTPEKFIFSDGKIAFLDLNLYKNSPHLEGANILKELLGFNQNSQFKKSALNKDEQGNNTFFKDYYIDFDSWNLLDTFVKTGSIYSYKTYLITKSDKCMQNTIKSLDLLNTVSNILGGIPVVEKLYSDFFKNLEYNYIENYNPLLPIEDVKDKYVWAILHNRYTGDQTNFEIRHNCEKGWSCVNDVYKHSDTFLYYRKPKNA